MNTLLAIIFSFYPATLVWLFIPDQYIAKLDSLATTPFTHFLAFLVAYGILFFISFKIIRRFISSSFLSSRRGMVGNVLRIIFALALLVIVFYQILPGAGLYPAPSFINEYILASPYSFFAVLVPLTYLFFD